MSPSEKYSCSLSPLMFAKGSTAIECGGGLKAVEAATCFEIQNLSATKYASVAKMTATIASSTGFDLREARTGSLSPGAAPDTARQRRQLRRQQALDPFDESWRCLASRQARPLHLSKALRYIRARVTRVIDDDRNQKRYAVGHVGGAIHRELPLPAEVPLVTSVRVRGDEGHEERAVVDLAPDLLIPRIPTPQLALIEKDLDAGRTQSLANLLSRLRILRGVA